MSWKSQSTESDAKISKIYENQTKKRFFLKKDSKMHKRSLYSSCYMNRLKFKGSSWRTPYDRHVPLLRSWHLGASPLNTIEQAFCGFTLFVEKGGMGILPTQKGKLVNSKRRID